MTQFLKRTLSPAEKKIESPNAQIRPDSTVNCLVGSLCPSRGTWGLNTAHFICWTTWELGARGITMRMPSVSRELTKPAPLPPPGPLHWWTLTRKLKECLPLSDPKGSPATTTTAATATAASPPSVLPTHHPVAVTAIYSLSIPASLACPLHLSLTFSLWISLSVHPLSVPLWALKELYYWPALSVTAPTDRLLKAQLYVSIHHVLKVTDPSKSSTQIRWKQCIETAKLSMKCLKVHPKKKKSYGKYSKTYGK